MTPHDPQAAYESPFAWRYGSAAMRGLWSEFEKRKGWRRVWVALAEADPFLAANIIRGERLYALDPDEADEYELYVLRRAGDLAELERERMALILHEEPPKYDAS